MHPAFDMETRIVRRALDNLVFASVYVPNGGKDYAAKMRFLRALVDWAGALEAQGRNSCSAATSTSRARTSTCIPSERKPGVIGQRDEERALFDALLGDGLVDVARALDPDNDRLFTWWPPWRNMRKRNIGWRIDYILASRAIAERATGARCSRRSAPAITRR